MRKIISKHGEKKSQRTNQFIIGGLLVLVMVLSTVGFAIQGDEEESSSDKVDYKGFEFTNVNNFWLTNIGGMQFVFKNNPLQVEDIYAGLNYINDLNSYHNKPLYLYSEDKGASLEIYKNLNQIVQRIQPACLGMENLSVEIDLGECDEDLPIKTCEDNFIIIKESNVSEIVQKRNCVFVQAPAGNLTEIADVFLFRTLGIE